LLAVASWEDVSTIALGLPEAVEQMRRGSRSWSVRDRAFAWERPLRPREVAALGERAPDGPIIAARVEHLVAKEALLADDPDVYFTTPHFDGFPAVLALLERLAPAELEELLVEAWLARAPKTLVRAFVEDRGLADPG
jgi:hypothetical protein